MGIKIPKLFCENYTGSFYSIFNQSWYDHDHHHVDDDDNANISLELLASCSLHCDLSLDFWLSQCLSYCSQSDYEHRYNHPYNITIVTMIMMIIRLTWPPSQQTLTSPSRGGFSPVGSSPAPCPARQKSQPCKVTTLVTCLALNIHIINRGYFTQKVS